jgi:hypothetical protein
MRLNSAVCVGLKVDLKSISRDSFVAAHAAAGVGEGEHIFKQLALIFSGVIVS